MASPGLASHPRSKTKRVVYRSLLALFLLAIVAAAGAGVWLWSVARSALPQVDGTIQVGGLHAPVTVIRDGQDVPHITAAGEDDLFFAQGYVTAQDRLWQMDISRRWASGDAAEILGASVVGHDREQRILGIRQVAERSLASLAPEERSRWEAYARGVNAFLESHRTNLPLEFRLLRYQPRPWTVLDSLLCGANLPQALNHYEYAVELAREQVTKKLGPDLAADLYPNSSWRDHPPGLVQSDFETSDEEENTNQEELPPPPPPRRQRHTSQRPAGPRSDARPLDLLSLEPVAPGSNNWAISGAHTASGKPLLSNDMHLVNTIPNTWYEIHLTIKGTDPALDVAGVTVPGMPYVVVGHNRRIAWGFTNLGPAVEDIYVENVNAKGEYETPDGWRPIQRRHEVIHVKNAPDVEMDVLATRHGPVITPLVPGETRTLALRWTLFEVSMRNPFYAVDTARNWDEFRGALSRFEVPSQNAVYADVDGHIGYQATGKIPIRPAGDDASMPVPGNDNAHEWTGYVAFDDLPRVFDPPSGIVATANGRIAPDDYPHLLSNEWGPPYRTARIYQVLGTNKKFTPADTLALQTDVESAYDKFCADRFVYAVDHTPNASENARAAANLMRGWDGRVTTDSRAAEMAASVRAEVWRTLLEPHLGAAPKQPASEQNPISVPVAARGWHAYSWFMSSVAFENLLTRQPDKWLPPGYHSFDEMIATAVDRATQDAASSRPWGEEHRIELRHPVFGVLPLIGKFFGTGSQPIAGDGTTVKQIAGLLGPSERFTADFGDLDRSTLNIVTGESGQVFSPHFMDQWKAWYEGTTFALPFSEGAVKSSAQHTLTLTP